MTCIHKVKWSVKRPEDCRFRLSVSHYKDRIVAPDEYTGSTEVTPSDTEQVLPTKDKLVRDDITVNPAPTEPLSTTSNGEFFPSSGYVGFSDVTVDVQPELTSLSVTENGLYLPESGTDGFDRVSVDVPQPSGSTTIVQNGTYNVEQYASAVVNVASKIGTLMEEVTLTSRQQYASFSFLELFSLTDNGIYLVTAENNDYPTLSSRFNALFAFKMPDDTSQDNGFSFKAITGDWTRSNASRTSTCYCSAGTILRCYRLPFPLPV